MIDENLTPEEKQCHGFASIAAEHVFFNRAQDNVRPTAVRLLVISGIV